MIAQSRSRTGTGVSPLRILSPVCLPIPPSGRRQSDGIQYAKREIVQLRIFNKFPPYGAVKNIGRRFRSFKLETTFTAVTSSYPASILKIAGGENYRLADSDISRSDSSSLVKINLWSSPCLTLPPATSRSCSKIISQLF